MRRDFIYNDIQYVRDLFWHLKNGPVIVSSSQLNELKLSSTLFAKTRIRVQWIDRPGWVRLQQEFRNKFTAVFPRYSTKGEITSWDVL